LRDIINTEPETPKREYIGFIRIAGRQEIRLRLMASSPLEARAMVVEEYGEGHWISLWNEEEARRPR
jgi:hypothetical protein